MTRAQARWITPFARGGYAARGVIYGLIGGLTLYAAWYGGGTTGSKGAIRTVVDSPAGGALAIVLIGGLAGYAAWRFVQAIFDTDDHGLDPRGLAVRGGLLASCFSYSALALYTGARWQGGSGGGGGGSGTAVADAIIGVIGSRVAAVLLALVFAVVAFAHLRKAWNRTYADHFDADADAMKFVDPISRLGLSARGLVFIVLSALLGWRAWAAGGTSGKPPGLPEALSALRDLPGGSILLGAMGAGLLCFALYSLIEARYRRINVEDA